MAGALLAGASIETASHFFEAGKNIGIAFQLKDDLLDAYGGEQFGKQNGGDILSNKKTYLYIRSLQLLNDSDAGKLKRLYTPAETGLQKIETVKKLFDSVNIQDETQKVMDEYHRLSLQHIEMIAVAGERKKSLLILFEGLMQRKK
jgi:geranylgeranyl diphosphate synthase type II